MTEKNKTLTVIIPAKNEEENVLPFYNEVEKIRKQFINKVPGIEYIFINDGSTDDTLQVIKDLRKKDDNVHFVSFSRNFGKESALYAGLKRSKGQLISVMDIDLQDPPELLPEMIDGVLSKEYDAVGSRRKDRNGESKIRSFFAKKFYSIISKVAQMNFVDGARDFRVMSREMVDSILELNERQRFSKGIFVWVGFKTKYISFENVERQKGQTNWSFASLMKYAIDGIVSFSTFPLIMVTGIGIFMVLAAIFFILLVIIRTIFWGNEVAGWSSTIVIILFASGIQLLSLGILGRYIAAIYTETKQRPIFISREEE